MVKLKLKKTKAETLHNKLKTLTNKGNKWFQYFRLKNISILGNTVEVMNDLRKSYVAPDGFLEYEKKRVVLCEKYCERDEQGKPRSINGKFVFPESTKPELVKELTKLQDEHKDDIISYDSSINQLNEVLEAEEEFELHDISFDNVPDGIDDDIMELMTVLIKE